MEFTAEHLAGAKTRRQLIAIAKKHKIPIAKTLENVK
jgi:hypothetical protein